MARWLALATVTAVLLAVAPDAGADTVRLPVGEAHGVRIVRDSAGAIVVVFTPRAARLWRRVAGKRVSVFCEERSAPDEYGYVMETSGGITFRAPRHGRRLRTGDLTRGMDLCRVSLAPRKVRHNGGWLHYARVPIVAIPMNQAGAVRLDEESRALALSGLLELANIVGIDHHLDRYPTSAELVADVPRVRRPLRLPVVELPSPSDTPPGGSIGYYSDGAHHVAAVLVSATGRRLFLEYDVDEVIRTNVLGYLLGN